MVLSAVLCSRHWKPAINIIRGRACHEMDHLWSCASKRSDPDEQLPEGARKHNKNSSETDGSVLIRYALCAVRVPSRDSPTQRRNTGHSNVGKSTCLKSSSGDRVTGTSTSCNRQFFPLPPLALLPCAERQADPSPPSSDDEKPTGDGSVKRGDENGVGTAAAVVGSWPGASRGVEAISVRYEVLAILGRGTFGRILLAECRANGRKMALKVGELSARWRLWFSILILYVYAVVCYDPTERAFDKRVEGIWRGVYM